MLPSRPASSGSSFLSSLWARVTTSRSSPASPERDDPPVVVVARGGIDTALSESLSHVIAVRPLGGQPPGINPLRLQEGAPAEDQNHVIDIRTPVALRDARGGDRKHAVPPDHVIDIRGRAGDEDEEAPLEVQAPARMARDGSRRLIPGVRFNVPPDAAGAVHSAARQAGASRAQREEVTTAQTWRMGVQIGLEHGACALVTQLAGRSLGLAVTSALRVHGADHPARALGASLGVAVASSVLFGSRAGLLITRALGLEEPPATCGRGDDRASDAAHLNQAARVATALTVVPLLTQTLLPVLGLYCGGTAVGVKIAATISGRLLSALVRDGLTQCVSGWFSSFDLVTPAGKRPDPKLVRNLHNPLRINLAVMLYTLASGGLLIGSADPMSKGISPAPPPQTQGGLMRDGLGGVLASSLNEGLDGFLLNLARAAAAIEFGMRLVPSGWLSERERQQAAHQGPRPPESKRTESPPPGTWERALDLADRIQAHAGMRMTFGTFTADIWNALTDIVKPRSPTAAMMFRVVGAILNGQTGRRGYTVELGRQPTQLEIEIKDRKAELKTEQQLGATCFMNTRADPRFEALRESLRREFRDRILAGGAIPQDAPDRAELLGQLDRAIELSASQWLDHQADEALRQHERSRIRGAQQGAYHFRTSSVINEMIMVEADSLQVSSSPSGAPTQGPSALVSQQASPRHRTRGLGLPLVDDVPAGPPVIPLQPQDLWAGRAISVDREPVTFLRRLEDGTLAVRATRNVQSLGWAAAPQEGEFVYHVEPIAISTISAGIDQGIGTGLGFAARQVQ